jgi:uncharacterized membrane protein
MPVGILRNQHGKMSGATIGTIVGTIGGYIAFGPWGAVIGGTIGGLTGAVVDYLTASDVVNEAESIAGMQVMT